MSIQLKVVAFREELRLHDALSMVQRKVTHGSCYMLDDDKYFDLKNVIANQYKIHHSQVVVVGSAKLGFSIAPKKRYRAFSETSDIDVAFASPTLYDVLWNDVFEYWSRGGAWPHLDSFRQYHFRGWIRPDKLPSNPNFPRTKEWWDFFRDLSRSGKYGDIKITGALYKDWSFLEGYQRLCFEQCKTELDA
jgi:hypothetical protein